MIFASDLGNPEGPLGLSDGSLMVTEMRADRGCVTRLSADGKSRRMVAKTGRPNSIAMDRNGILWVPESINPPSLLRMTMDGKFEVVLTESEGEPFLFPNDLCFGPDGFLYMTDSGIMFKDWMPRRADYKNVHTDGRVYRIDTKTMKIQTLDSDIQFTNGIAFGPDKDLYVNATLTGMIYKYTLRSGKLGKRQNFADVVDRSLPERFSGPDGMKFGLNGDLYSTVTGQGTIAVLGPDGKLKKRIQLEGQGPTNIAFGLPGQKKIFVTEQSVGQVEAYQVETDGLPLYK